jgi:hypothetical protein
MRAAGTAGFGAGVSSSQGPVGKRAGFHTQQHLQQADGGHVIKAADGERSECHERVCTSFAARSRL